jgi:hypothetical protein
MALVGGMQSPYPADQVRDIRHRSPADHGRPVHAVYLLPQVGMISALSRSSLDRT